MSAHKDLIAAHKHLVSLFGALAPLYLNGMFDLVGRYDAAVYTIIGILIYSSAAILTFGPYKFAIHKHA